MLYGRTYENKIRDSKFIIQCDKCLSLREVTYTMYKYIYPTKPNTKPKCTGLCVKCTNDKPNKTSFKKGFKTWNKGHGNIKEVQKARASPENYQWKKAVLKRDNYTCVLCGSKEKLSVDHIKSFTFYPELRYDINNGRTLCMPCHFKTDNFGYRKVHEFRDKTGNPVIRGS